MTVLISWFQTDDIYQRLSVLFLLACLFGYTTNITDAFSGTYSQLIAFYLAARLYMGTYLVLVACLVPMVRGVMVSQIVPTVIAAAIWIASIYVPYPQQLALIWIAIILELAGHHFSWLLAQMGNLYRNDFGRWLEKQFEFIPGMHVIRLRAS